MRQPKRDFKKMLLERAHAQASSTAAAAHAGAAGMNRRHTWMPEHPLLADIDLEQERGTLGRQDAAGPDCRGARGAKSTDQQLDSTTQLQGQHRSANACKREQDLSGSPAAVTDNLQYTQTDRLFMWPSATCPANASSVAVAQRNR
jgi:hypothetical protein